MKINYHTTGAISVTVILAHAVEKNKFENNHLLFFVPDCRRFSFHTILRLLQRLLCFVGLNNLEKNGTGMVHVYKYFKNAYLMQIA